MAHTKRKRTYKRKTFRRTRNASAKRRRHSTVARRRKKPPNALAYRRGIWRPPVAGHPKVMAVHDYLYSKLYDSASTDTRFSFRLTSPFDPYIPLSSTNSASYYDYMAARYQHYRVTRVWVYITANWAPTDSDRGHHTIETANSNGRASTFDPERRMSFIAAEINTLDHAELTESDDKNRLLAFKYPRKVVRIKQMNPSRAITRMKMFEVPLKDFLDKDRFYDAAPNTGLPVKRVNLHIGYFSKYGEDVDRVRIDFKVKYLTEWTNPIAGADEAATGNPVDIDN